MPFFEYFIPNNPFVTARLVARNQPKFVMARLDRASQGRRVRDANNSVACTAFAVRTRVLANMIPGALLHAPGIEWFKRWF